MSLKAVKLADGKMIIVPASATILNPEGEGRKRFAMFVWPQPTGKFVEFNEAVKRGVLFVYLSDFADFGKATQIDLEKDDAPLTARQVDAIIMVQLFIHTAADLVEAGVRAVNHCVCDISGRMVPITTDKFEITRV